MQCLCSVLVNNFQSNFDCQLEKLMPYFMEMTLAYGMLNGDSMDIFQPYGLPYGIAHFTVSK